MKQPRGFARSPDMLIADPASGVLLFQANWLLDQAKLLRRGTSDMAT
jgi:hypothetical protein